MTALLGWLGNALLAMFGGIDWPALCPYCNVHRHSQRAMRAHIDFQHQDEVTA